LGVAVDEENGIFYNRKQGYFRFTIENGRSYLEPGEIEYLQIMKTRSASTDAAQRKIFCLDFGDAWLLNELIARSGLRNILNEACPEESDTLLSLVAFKLLDDSANCLAEHWRSGSYAKYLFPSARMESQRISEFMEKLGDEGFKRRFFDLYIPYLKRIPGLTENVLIDSTGLPNDICFDVSQVNNHNGVISREARLIYVVERNSGFPVFFRYVPGNTVDVSTLRVTLNIMKEYGVDIAHSILDAGYSSSSNLARLLKDRIPFLIRLPDNASTKKYLKERSGGVLDEPNSLKYGNRRMFIKQDVYMVGDITCHAWVVRLWSSCVSFRN
jgi:hypothetical protein